MQDTRLSDYDVIIVGAGLAGLSAGVYLSQSNKRVLILESRDILGGRTSSWIEKGMHVESGFHRYLGFYSEFPKLIEKAALNLDTIFSWGDEIVISLPNGEGNATFGLAPVHSFISTVSGALGNNDFLSVEDKAEIAGFFKDAFLDYSKDKDTLDLISLYDYAKQKDVSEKVIHRILEPLSSGIFFISIKEYSTYNFLQLLFPFVPNILNSRVGSFSGPMTEVLAEPLAGSIQKYGGDIETGSKVTKILSENNNAKGVLCNQKEIFAENVILAVTVSSAKEILNKSFPDVDEFQKLQKMKTMPAITVQINLDSPALPNDLTHFSPGTIMASYTEQSRTTFKKEKGRLSIILHDPTKYE